MKEKTIKINGDLYFMMKMTEDDQVEILPQRLEDKEAPSITGDCFSGKKFLEAVKSHGICMSDGYIKAVLVDGFKSNLGLHTNNHFYHEGFMVCERIWLDMCSNYNVKVIWVNK